MNTIRLHDIYMHTTALGPGTRIAVWLQGCKRCCKGCMSPKSRPLDGGRMVDLDALIEEICSTHDVEGVTISGGEPFLQVQALYRLLSAIRNRTELGIIIYTGNTLSELYEMHNPMIDEIITHLSDLIIDGEYIDDLNDGTALKGSSNQNAIFITDRYLPYKWLYEEKRRDIEIKIENGSSLLIGVPDKSTLEMWRRISDQMKGEE